MISTIQKLALIAQLGGCQTEDMMTLSSFHREESFRMSGMM